MKRKGLLMLILPIMLMSCAYSKEHIDLFLYDESDTFINSLKNNIVDNLKDDYSINIYNSKRSQILQNQQVIDSLEHNKPNLLLVNMVDRVSSSAIIQKAQLSNTPIIFFNREPLLADILPYENTYYVGTNPKQEGINQAIMAEHLLQSNKEIDKNRDRKLQCVFLQGEQNHQDTDIRTKSCISHLRTSGYVLDILEMSYADWSKDKGYKAMSDFYKTFGNEIEFVFSNNDDMALGAIDYLKDNNLISHSNNEVIMPFPIVGVDGTFDGLKAVQEGYLYGTTINDKEAQAKAISQLVALINNKITKEQFEFEILYNSTVYVSGELVTNDNINKILAK